ncbi:hypothetical protein HF295_02130 [Hujiaoplasma nucleasis]|uniref:Uncharacterized protein n=1 Tax=Hujiaoplasma nucleasis TaxID=2725268 RepID=A0A7L6N572_9MOLU|nr:CueP family metal-binding protein [Hujiaoplasma nucleasis]QLY39719.1 hypothetical protein HF295_02130 [Hujiaoplasma nucleasis]
MKFKVLIIMTLPIVLLIAFISEKVLKKDESHEEVYNLIYQLENNLLSNNTQASIDHEKIYITEPSKSYEINMPDDLFYIAFAPYINLTHLCYNHSLTGCLGEMINKDIEVKIYNEENDLIKDKVMNTGHDGFIGLYLDPHANYQITVTYQDKTAVFTSNTLQTCYTEVRLK